MFVPCLRKQKWVLKRPFLLYYADFSCKQQAHCPQCAYCDHQHHSDNKALR